MSALTPKGELYRDVLASVFRLRALLLDSSEEIAAAAGLTTARWLVLGAIEHEPATVAHVARTLGLTRQAVQETADAMAVDGLLRFVDNPDHKRSKLMTPSPSGRAALDRLRPRQLQFANLMGASHRLDALRTTRAVLQASIATLESARSHTR